MNSLSGILSGRIRATGPLTVAEYMRAALAHPEYGYYMTRDPLGLGGDFVTAPEISQIFGELIGIWCAEIWLQMGSPDVHVVELGPGRGTLMKDFLRATAHIHGFHQHADIHMVETSPVLKQAQQATLTPAHPRIQWHQELPSVRGPMLVIANEFFDALPIRQFVATEKGFRERVVGLGESDQFEFLLAEEETHHLPTALPRIEAGTLPAGTIIEICPVAQQMMAQIASTIGAKGGAFLAIDYGYVRPEMMDVHAAGDTLQAVREHQYHDVLRQPGAADLTAHVDFSTLRQVAMENGRVASPHPETQGMFLKRMGAQLRIQQLLAHSRDDTQRQMVARGYERLTSPKEMGELFQVLAVTQASPALKLPAFA